MGKRYRGEVWKRGKAERYSKRYGGEVWERGK